MGTREVAANGTTFDRSRLSKRTGANALIKLAIIFLVVGLIAGVLGFTGIAGAAVGIAKFLFFVAIAIFVIMLVLGVTIYKKVT